MGRRKMKRIILYITAGITVVFLIAVAHYSLKEAIYDLGNKSPVQLSSNMSNELGKYVSVKSTIASNRLAHVGHQGIDMYFYPVNGFNKQLFIVTDGNKLPKEMIDGRTMITGQLMELSRIPFARSAYKDLKITPGTAYYAIKAGKAPNPRMIYTYIILLVIGSLFCIPIFIELKKARKESRGLLNEFAQVNA
jgi:hypothetical protein